MTSRLRSIAIINQPGHAVQHDPSVSLDLADDDRGFLPNRLSTDQRDAINSPPEGLTIYNTDTQTHELFNGVAWQQLVKSGGGGPTFVPLGNREEALGDVVITSTNTGGVMVGMGIIFTTIASGRLLVTMTGALTLDSGTQIQCIMLLGSGTPPALNDPLVGTRLGGLVMLEATNAPQDCSFSLTGYKSGLTIGTPYWFDVGFYLGSNSVLFHNITMTAIEL